MRRRTFLRSSSSGIALPFILPAEVWANPPSKRLAHASIGAGGMQGGSDLASIAASGLVEIVALADVDRDHLSKAAQAHPSARQFQDWREMFATMADKIDSVNIAVPDHMHGPIALTALKHKKHVYCQKPLAHTVGEARQMRLKAKEAGVVTQMGNQIQSDSTYRTAVKMLRDGVIGKIKEVRCWCSSSFAKDARPDGADPVPSGLDWDKWLGVAPSRPYKKGQYHPVQWRGWQDFGGGTLGDFGCHIMDTPFKALGLTAPLKVRASVPDAWAQNPKRNREVWPDWEVIHYEFPGTEFTAGSILPVSWHDASQRPPVDGIPLDAGRELPANGAVFLGEKGALLLPHVARPQLLPYAADRAFKHEVVAGNPQEHYTQFVKTCLGLDGARTTSNFDFAGPLAEATMLGTIAVRFPDKDLEWDAAALTFRNHAEASAFVQPKYREGWTV